MNIDCIIQLVSCIGILINSGGMAMICYYSTHHCLKPSASTPHLIQMQQFCLYSGCIFPKKQLAVGHDPEFLFYVWCLLVVVKVICII